MKTVWVLFNDDDTVFQIFTTKEKAEKYLRDNFNQEYTYDDWFELYYLPSLNPGEFPPPPSFIKGEIYYIVEHPVDEE